MTQLLSRGLEVSAIGMSLTFAALGLLVLVMVLLERAFRRESADTGESQPGVAPNKVDAHTDEIALAVCVAAAYLNELERENTGLGATLGTGHGAWWSRGRVARTGNSTSKRSTWSS